MDRVKSLRQKKADGSYTSPISLGTDGILVDMASGLDSEQEFKLGGNHDTVIEEQNNITTIIETYKALNNATITYIVETTINEVNNTITTVLKKNGITIRSKTINITVDGIETTIQEGLT